MGKEIDSEYGPLSCNSSCSHECQCGRSIKLDEYCRNKIFEIIERLQTRCGKKFFFDADSSDNGRSAFNGITIISSEKFEGGRYSILEAAARIRGGWITYNEKEIQPKSQP